MSKPCFGARVRSAGFAMIEVLTTLVVVLLGLLGTAGLLIHTHQSSFEAYQRVQALILMEDIAQRISANRQVAECYAISAPSGAPFLGVGAAPVPNCGAGTPAQQARAQADLAAWSDLLQGAAERDANDANMGAMIGARGCIWFDAAAGAYVVSVVWQGMSRTAAPPAELSCAAGQYGDEAQRRAVAISLQFANL